jgi:trimeric autotransporter adhesin
MELTQASTRLRGLNALFNLTTGTFNSAFGFSALKADTTGGSNAAVGAQALLHNNGSSNTAIGENALVFNTSGSQNMALGQGALANNLIGNNNTAMGFEALHHNTVDDNTAVGHSALLHNTTGDDNTATGEEALLNNTTASNNTAVGGLALSTNTIISNNTAVGWKALQFSNPAAGGGPNTAVRFGAGFSITGDFNIDIGAVVLGLATDSHTTRIGLATGSDKQTACFIGGISGVVVSGAAVLVSTSGQLGVASSSARFKDEIKPMDKASEAILALKPVTFR